MNKPLPKSLHTVTVLANLCIHFMETEDQGPLDAMERSMGLLGYPGFDDPHGLVQKALAVVAKTPEVQVLPMSHPAPRGKGWVNETGSLTHNKWVRPRAMLTDQQVNDAELAKLHVVVAVDPDTGEETSEECPDFATAQDVRLTKENRGYRASIKRVKPDWDAQARYDAANGTDNGGLYDPMRHER